jgi:RimJ/RimL family protein N-acetyltransferase
LLSREEERENQQSWREAGDKLTFILCQPLAGESAGAAGDEEADAGVVVVVSGVHDAPARMIGDINLFIHPADDDEEGGEWTAIRGGGRCDAEIDIMLAEPAFRAKGIGKAAVRALIGYVCRHADGIMGEYSRSLPSWAGAAATLRDLMVKIQATNAGSMRLFEGAGFARVNKGTNYFGEVELVLAGERWRGMDGGEGYREVEYRR